MPATKSYFDARTIPGIAYTDPEVAWMGLTETEAKAKGIPMETASFPWAASGRALGNGRDDGITKLIHRPESKRILGAGIVGVNAGELLAEAVLALEMNADIHDLALSVHAHQRYQKRWRWRRRWRTGRLPICWRRKTQLGQGGRVRRLPYRCAVKPLCHWLAACAARATPALPCGPVWPRPVHRIRALAFPL